MWDQGLDIDIGYFTADPALNQAVYAVASAHRVSRGYITASDALLASKQARLSAIKALRKNLANTALGEDVVCTPFSINVLLCILDGMIEPYTDDTATLHHFAGGKAILRSCEHVEQILTVQTGPISLHVNLRNDGCDSCYPHRRPTVLQRHYMERIPG